MKYVGWVLVAIVVIGAGWIGYYYGLGRIGTSNQSDEAQESSDLSLPYGDIGSDLGGFNSSLKSDNGSTTSSPTVDSGGPITVQCTNEDWDCLIQAANAGNNARLIASSYADISELFGVIIYGTNEFKISNVASNGDVTFEDKVISADVRVSEEVRQELLSQGSTEAEIAQAEEEMQAEQNKTIGSTRKGIFSKTSFVLLIQNWKVGNFSTDDWNPHTAL